MNKVIVLSGGLDSTILMYKIVAEFGADKVFALTFDYNQKHKVELEKAKALCLKLGVNHKIINIDFLSDISKDVCALSGDSNIQVPTIKEVLGNPQPVTYVPNRNMILASIGLAYAETIQADSVYCGLQTHDMYSYWDCSTEFVDALNNVSMLNRKNKINVLAPFISMSKYEEILIGSNLNVDFSSTLTCYDATSDGISCGVCGSCSERIFAFAKAGFPDPIPYSKEIDWDKLMDRV